jgi:hypothetical protein
MVAEPCTVIECLAYVLKRLPAPRYRLKKPGGVFRMGITTSLPQIRLDTRNRQARATGGVRPLAAGQVDATDGCNVANRPLRHFQDYQFAWWVGEWAGGLGRRAPV